MVTRERGANQHRVVGSLLLLVSILSTACQSPIPFLGGSVSLQGYWEGTITMKGQTASLIWNLQKSETGYAGIVEVRAEGGSQGYYVQLARVRGREVEVISSFGGLGSLTFVGKASGNNIEGRFTGHAVGDPVSGEFRIRKVSDTPRSSLPRSNDTAATPETLGAQVVHSHARIGRLLKNQRGGFSPPPACVLREASPPRI